MTWLERYRLRHYVRNSIWILPAFAVAFTLVFVRVLHWVEDAMGWRVDINPDTMRNVLGTLAGAMFTFIVFVCSTLLLVVQLASAQLTPRVIGTMFRDRVTKITLSIFVFNFVFVLSTLIRINETVPLLISLVATYSCAISLAVFLFMIDHIGKLLRPSGVFKAVTSQAHRVINDVYPRRFDEPRAAPTQESSVVNKDRVRSVTSSHGGVVLAFDVNGLLDLATRHDCVIEMVPQVGNYVAPGDPLFHVYGGGDVPLMSVRHSIALGIERTIEQDPAFAFRVIVDIASKGLSPAINDPTTAVLALDQIHHLLRHVGSRRLDNEKVRDAHGRIRLIYRTPDWDDYVALAVTEIRQFGGSSIQIARRMRAMLEDLIQTLPAERAQPLQLELKLLKRSAERFFHDPEDRALADQSDSQGVGGTRETG